MSTGVKGITRHEEVEDQSRPRSQMQYVNWTLEARQQFVAFALGLHYRCGANSAVRLLADSHLLQDRIGKPWIMSQERKVTWVLENGISGGGRAVSMSCSFTCGILQIKPVCILKPGMTTVGFAGPQTAVLRELRGGVQIMDTATGECTDCMAAPFDGFASNGKWALLYCRSSGEFTMWPCGEHKTGQTNMTLGKPKWLEFTEIDPAIPKGDEFSMLTEGGPGRRCIMHIDIGATYSVFRGGALRAGLPVKAIKAILKLQSGILKRGAESLAPVHKSNGTFSFTELSLDQETTIPHEWRSTPHKVDETRFAVLNRNRTQLTVYCTDDLSRPCCQIPLPQRCHWCSSGNGIIGVCESLAGSSLYDAATGCLLFSQPFADDGDKDRKLSLHSFSF
ncbi:hypothetical protein Pelo_12507 [Pelomyxa schiedti]|nr:hypothetical protein Pelo_12507 [Pelomyxa schiedti]